ncbi:SAICAR synthase-like protein [Aulographum hederae CBS 113979]|uniref:1-phosphatidylinositol-4-phosphate 5-kinase n=1 Tax=Aulographum hederae CBS 113979 TaxID=1176131 RepID=A0A6G1GT07_9PEZI|nr:SAICAR synthase-like protein [Aulographum hederae CBS 113979]
MPAVLVEHSNGSAFANPDLAQPPPDKPAPARKQSPAPMSNGDAPKQNGNLSNGVDSNRNSLSNGHTAFTMDESEFPWDNKTQQPVTNGRKSDAENEKKPLNRRDTEETSTRDDGSFATVESSKSKKCFGTNYVKLEAPVNGIAAIPTHGGIDVLPDAVPMPGTPKSKPQQENASQEQPAADGQLAAPTNKSSYRISSPPSFSSPLTPISTSASRPDKLQHRHTLEVPKVSTSRLSREFGSSNTSANPSEDVLTATGRFSPNTPTKPRRSSAQLVRRATRSIHSDMHLDEVPQDEDAARWAEAIKQKRMSKRKKKEEEDDDRVVVGTKVDQNHVNWVTAYNMLTGIRFTVSRTNAKMDRELEDIDFDAKHKFSFDITGNELTPSTKYDFKFKDYAPFVFRHLRAKFKLDPADYLMSLTSKYILSELGSPGKSGSFFYFSRDYKYIIKTIHHAEHKFLRKILREYYAHIQQNPNTLLSQFYGLHRVKIPYGRKIHFVVMNNLFPPHRDIHRTFDLKGSTIGRDFREEDLEKNPRATLKDLNWLRRNLHLEFGPTKRRIFIEQMEKDVKLLQRLKIMDYSMLIGIHDLERGNEEKLRDKTLQVFQPGGDQAEDPQKANALARTPSKLENQRKAKELRQMIKHQKPVPMDQTSSKMPDEVDGEGKGFFFYNDDGGFRATHEDDRPGEEIYYLGIIDCLTHYGLIKRGEHFFKGLRNTESQISAIPPERYGDRFVRFVSGVTKTREAAEKEKAELNATKRPEEQSATERITGSLDDPRLGGMNLHHTTSTDKVMEKAEHQAAKSERAGRSEDNVPNVRMSAVRSPSAERGEPSGYTLPVVEEAVESGSTGGLSARSGDVSPMPLTSSPGVLSDGKPPPTPPKDGGLWDGHGHAHLHGGSPLKRDGPPTPPKDSSGNGGGHASGITRRSLDKELPPAPPELENPISTESGHGHGHSHGRVGPRDWY